MATLNLGRIKPVFQGAYSNSTAYVVDDIVTSGDETFICIQASTGNATSNASYWTKLAAKGTDGTDVGTTLTTQGDMLYRDGSGLQRLAKGTASQVLKMNSGANAPEWGTLSNDYVKLASADTSGVSEVIFDNYFTSDYHHYKFIGSATVATNNHRVDFNPRISGANQLANRYESATYNYKQWSGSTSNNLSVDATMNDTNGGRLGWGRTDTPMIFEVLVCDAQNSSVYKMCHYTTTSFDNTYLYVRQGGNNWRTNTNAFTGFRFFNPGGGNCTWKITMYGIKK